MKSLLTIAEIKKKSAKRQPHPLDGDQQHPIFLGDLVAAASNRQNVLEI
jgi:hypothetical protein